MDISVAEPASGKDKTNQLQPLLRGLDWLLHARLIYPLPNGAIYIVREEGNGFL